MAVKINFDCNNNVIDPVFVLAHRNGKLIGNLPVRGLQFKDTLNSYSSARFDVYKEDIKSINELVRVSGFHVNKKIGSISQFGGSTTLWQISGNKYLELKRYFESPENISNPELLIKNGEGGSLRFDMLSFSINDTGSLFISDIDDTKIIQIFNDGIIHFLRASSFGYGEGDIIDVSFSFSVPASACENHLWDQIKDLKLAWARDWNMFFELKVDVREKDSLVKNVSCTSLGEAELSQIRLYNIEINTEADIERDSYVPTLLYNNENKDASLLDRITEKAPHYKIKHVDNSIKDIQRTFTFSDKSIYDAFQEISKEIDCLFVIKCSLDENGEIKREIYVYDLKSYCLDCGARGEFLTKCDKCGSTNILTGYGEDTTIFITNENLADDITLTTDLNSTKNCFRLEAGDDLMTSAIASCNPNGSSYIWYIPDDTKDDMSNELVSKLSQYDVLYKYYQEDHEIELDSDLIDTYNSIIDKYSQDYNDLSNMPQTITGYPDLMLKYYDTIDFYLYLNNTMMPRQSATAVTAQSEASKLYDLPENPIAVQDISRLSLSTATSAVLQMAKIIVDSKYQVKVVDSFLDGNIWSGIFNVSNYSDDEDTATTSIIYIQINDDYEYYVKQKIEKVLNKQPENSPIVSDIFKLDSYIFTQEIKKYCLSILNAFRDSCHSCVDVLIEYGISDKDLWSEQSKDLYNELYLPYYEKIGLIEHEISVREEEIAAIVGVRDQYGELISSGVQTVLLDEIAEIQDTLDFETYLGDELWNEFAAYRREDTYKNDNFISDGLNNAELFRSALEFMESARSEIYKSATLQHSISASLNNLLVIKEFSPIVDYFNIGNWLRIRIDGKIYRLRLIEYSIDFDGNISHISVVFSDVKDLGDSISDIENIQNQAKAIASSYNYVTRQASKGQQSKSRLDNWVKQGLSLTNMKIVNNADEQNITWDSHGILCREYFPITDDYDDRQLKIINRGLYLTDDNWRTSRAGIGNFMFYNPETGNMEEAYGVIADTLVGSLVLSEKVGVYNRNNSIILGENGLTITADNSNPDAMTSFTIQRKEKDALNREVINKILYIGSDGNLVLNGSIQVNASSDNGGILTLNDLADNTRVSNVVNESVFRVLNTNQEQVLTYVLDSSGNIMFDVNGNARTKYTTVSGLYGKIEAQYNNSVAYTQYMLNQYKSELSQYMRFDSDNGLVLGAVDSSGVESAFKTVIDNNRMAFFDGESVAAYISNSQLYIPNAVIENTLTIGRFFISPRSDGGASITWRGSSV